MTKIFYLVLILSLVPLSDFVTADRKNHNHIILVAEDRSQTLYCLDTLGILPKRSSSKTYAKTEQLVPFFVGISSNFQTYRKVTGELRQKKKLRGI